MNRIRHFLIFQTLMLLMTVVLSIYFKQYLILTIAAIPVLLIIKHTRKWQHFLTILFLVVLVTLGMLFIPNEWKLINLSRVINDNISNNLRYVSISYLSDIYDVKTMTFLKLLLFNEKSYDDQTYLIFKDLGVLHLFVVSGLHVSVLTNIFNKFFSKKMIIGKIINLTICCLLWYFSNFSLPIFRIVLLCILSFFRYFKSYSSFSKNVVVAIFICIFFVKDAASYSFILTFICILLINFINEKISSPIIKFLSINLAVFVITLPIVITFNKGFNALAFINNFGFSWAIIAIYVFELFLVWIPLLSQFNSFLILNVINFFEKVLSLQPIIQVNPNQYLIIAFYWSVFSCFNWKWSREINAKPITINYNNLYVKK